MKEMNYPIRVAILLLSVLFFQGCTSSAFNLDDYDKYIKSTNSEMITYYENGTIRTRISIEKGIKSGVANSYYPDGSKKSELYYVNGKISGVSKGWYNSGTLKGLEVVKNGVRQGYRKSYYESGVKKEVVLYKDGNPIDINMYNEDGSILYSKDYRENGSID